MGLDNSLIIRGKTIKGKQYLADNFSHLNLDDCYEPGEYGIFYFRKCWNVRNRFLHVFKDHGYDGEGGELTITVPELVDVVEYVLKYFLEEKNWEVDGDSIWEWYRRVPGIAEAIRTIRIFLEEFEDEDNELTEEDFEIEFIDSY